VSSDIEPVKASRASAEAISPSSPVTPFKRCSWFLHNTRRIAGGMMRSVSYTMFR
jgi:hypothetical protein